MSLEEQIRRERMAKFERFARPIIAVGDVVFYLAMGAIFGWVIWWTLTT